MLSSASRLYPVRYNFQAAEVPKYLSHEVNCLLLFQGESCLLLADLRSALGAGFVDRVDDLLGLPSVNGLYRNLKFSRARCAGHDWFQGMIPDSNNDQKRFLRRRTLGESDLLTARLTFW